MSRKELLRKLQYLANCGDRTAKAAYVLILKLSSKSAVKTIAGVLLLLAVSLSAQTPDPSTLPLVRAADLTYVGAFKVPDTGANGGWLSFAGSAIIYNPANNSLFISNRDHVFAEITIEPPVKSVVLNDLNRGHYLQGFQDPSEGHWNDANAMAGNGFGSNSGLVVNGKLLVSGVIYYDANGIQQASHFSRSTNLTLGSFSGWTRFSGVPQTGYVSGWMAAIPAEWQAKLGGAALTGQCCIPIVSRTSNGPSAFAFDPTKIGQATASAVPLIYYDGVHATLGPWEGSNPVYGATASIAGMVFPVGTRSLLYFGRNGIGPHCYGDGTADKALVTEHLCYDPTTNTKGSHAYPYNYQVWAYDANDLAAVKAGAKQPWEVVPAVWPLTIPNDPDATLSFGGVAYDPSKQLIYVSQMMGDGVGGWLPLIHVFKVNASGVVTPPPPPDPPPPPPPPPPVDPKVLELEQRIAAIKALIQQAITAAPKNTATKVMTPLKTALSK